MASTKSSRKHVAIFTFPFTSHPLPLFNLACKLASASPEALFSFFSSEHSNRSLLSSKGKANTPLPPNLKTYNVEANVPEGVDLAKNPFKEGVFFIKNAPRNFRIGVEAAAGESGRSVTCLVCDTFFASVVASVGEELSVPWVSFWVASPCALLAYVCYDLVREAYVNFCSNCDGDIADCTTLEVVPGLSRIHALDLPEDMVESFRGLDKGPDSAVFSKMMRDNAVALPRAAAVAMNSYELLSPAELTSDLKSKFNEFLYLGFLTLSVPPPPLPSMADLEDDGTGCLSWLDKQAAASVAYVCFGTMGALPPEELAALAEALEASGVPFVWSIRDELAEHLPRGFAGRTTANKLVAWAPQREILAHGAVGAHVTHCGYNSLCESILGGVPVICRPLWADNHINARMAEEVWKVGVRVEKGVVTKKGMLSCLEAVFRSPKGKQLREAVGALKEAVVEAASPDGNAARDFESLLEIISNA